MESKTTKQINKPYKNRPVETENKLMVAKGERSGEMDEKQILSERRLTMNLHAKFLVKHL